MICHRRNALATLALGLAAPGIWAGAYEDFFVAILRDDDAAIAALLRRGFDPNTRDPKGQVGLTIALQNGSSKAFAALLASSQVNVEARNAQDESPLMMAALKGNLEAVKALLARDATRVKAQLAHHLANKMGVVAKSLAALQAAAE